MHPGEVTTSEHCHLLASVVALGTLMGIKVHQNSPDSPRPEVGEIDTRAPFQSVKAAVSLFGEGTFIPERPALRKAKTLHTERVFAKETQLHLAQKEVNKLKDQLKNSEVTKAQALVDLEKAKKTLDELTHKLQSVTALKEAALKATEAAKIQVKQLENGNFLGPAEGDSSWRHELDKTREEYTQVIVELDAAKQELRQIRQDFQASINTKVTAFHQAEEAEHVTAANKERAEELSREIASVQEALFHVKMACTQAKEEKARILSEKDAHRISYKLALEESQKKMKSIKGEFDPSTLSTLEEKLAQTNAEIEAVQQELEHMKLSDMESMKAVSTELEDAKQALQKVVDEENSLKKLVESLQGEIQAAKKEHEELRKKEAEAETVASDLHAKLQRAKVELNAAIAAELKVRGASEELLATLHQLTVDSENAREEMEVMKKEADTLRQEADAARAALTETEGKLQVAMKEAEIAKAAEAKALGQIKILSEKADASRASTSETGAQIRISKEEYETLSHKVEESNMLAEMKVAAALAQVEAVRASENEALKKLEVTRKEIEEMKGAMEEALKRAEMAEAAKRTIEGELRKWREHEQKAAEAASKTSEGKEVNAVVAGPVKRNLHVRSSSFQKGEKATGSKKTLLPTLSGIFQKKKSGFDVGSPSYLPGEKPL